MLTHSEQAQTCVQPAVGFGQQILVMYLNIHIGKKNTLHDEDQDSSVGVATPYGGWTVRGSNPGGGEIFRTRPDRSRGPTSLLYDG